MRASALCPIERSNDLEFIVALGHFAPGLLHISENSTRISTVRSVERNGLPWQKDSNGSSLTK
jgi:hypothetical protein